ncbi:(+)-neomenthol dehydrogenase-like [Henckelia pumila]|uniref:(+)-neomenthol dehydrogenase-like n=1 Tax=Henckelia pumila TaxID=405737 RepID=UPI003C6E82CE
MDKKSCRCAVVTGANKGIGLEICKQLANDGIHVVLTARDATRGVEAVTILNSHLIIFHQLDVMNKDSIASLATFINNHFGKLDILVNNAGIGGVTVDLESYNLQKDKQNANKADLLINLTTQTYEMAEECVETNYYGIKRVTEALLPSLLLSDSPRIVNVSARIGKIESIPSETIKQELSNIDLLTREKLDELLARFLKDFERGALESEGWPLNLSAYRVSKAAANAYTRILAKENAAGLCVNCVCPGFVKTDMNSNMGTLTVEEGAKGAVMLALLPKDETISGMFYQGTQLSNF